MICKRSNKDKIISEDINRLTMISHFNFKFCFPVCYFIHLKVIIGQIFLNTYKFLICSYSFFNKIYCKFKLISQGDNYLLYNQQIRNMLIFNLSIHICNL